jgi:hypothetical protein
MSDSKESKAAAAPSGTALSWIDLPPIEFVRTAQDFQAAKKEFQRAIAQRYEDVTKVGADDARVLASLEVLESITYVEGRFLAVYRQGGVAIGLMSFSFGKGYVHIDQLVGNPHFRNVGSLLLEYALNLNPENPKLVLLPIDAGPQKFYKDMGFVPGSPQWSLDPTREPGSKIWTKVGKLWRRIAGSTVPLYLGLFEPPVKRP